MTRQDRTVFKLVILITAVILGFVGIIIANKDYDNFFNLGFSTLYVYIGFGVIIVILNVILAVKTKIVKLDE